MKQTNGKSSRRVESVSKRKLIQHLSPLERHVYPFIHRKRDFIVETGPDSSDGPVYVLLPAVLNGRRKQRGTRALVISSSVDRVQLVAAAKKRFDGLAGVGQQILGLGAEEATRREADELSAGPGIVVATSRRIIDHVRRDNLHLDKVHTVVIDEPHEDEAAAFNLDVQFILSKISHRPHICAFTPNLHEETDKVISLLRRPRVFEREAWATPRVGSRVTRKEHTVTDSQNDRNLPTEDSVKSKIEDIIRLIHDEEDPDELNYYRKLVRKHVPFFSRGYFAAFLLKNGTPAARKPRQQKNGDVVSVFIGVGKNRRVFPRDLIQLFGSVDSVNAEDVGEIKILDNYSFAEVTTAKADAVIEKLNGTEYRGRKLTVNYARRKD